MTHPLTFSKSKEGRGSPGIPIPDATNGIAIYAYIGVVSGGNVGIYGSPISRVWVCLEHPQKIQPRIGTMPQWHACPSPY